MNGKRRWFIFLIMLSIFDFLLVPSYSVNAAPTLDNPACSAERGLDITFVLDDSGTMLENDPLNIRLSESGKLMDALNEYDRGAIIKFTDEAENLQSLTSNRYLINKAFSHFISSGGTDMSAGIQVALSEFDLNGGNNHKIMVILTDGDSVNNSLSLQLAHQAYVKGITIFTIGLGSASNINSNVLTQIANETGGQYFHATNAAALTTVFANITKAVEDIREPKVYSDWTLTQDIHETGDLVLNENMKMNLNGYDLQVDGDLVLRSCAQLRAVSGQVTAGNLEQEAGSSIQLNNSQLEVLENFTQDGFLRVNGEYGSTSEEEMIIHGDYDQQVRGGLDLNGFKLTIDGSLDQEGNIGMAGGTIVVENDVAQKGYFDLGQGALYILGNLNINGGPLVDDEFKENKSLNVNGGYLKVGSVESMDTDKGNVVQDFGQLYVNYGIVDIFGDYTINDGWLTMIHATMDTSSESLMVDDGDYVHVYGDFTTRSPRSHAARTYSYLGNPMNDQAHLTDGILRVDGNFKQIGDKQFNSSYSDRSQGYTKDKDYSRFNFAATGRHKVILTGKGSIEMAGTGSQFNLLQLNGLLGDYTRTGPVRWNVLKETSLSANANLASLMINDVAVHDFNPAVLNYSNHTVAASGVTGPLQTLKVDARADDFRNAKVEVTGNSIGVDGTAQVKILVTAHDGETKKLYTVNVTVGDATVGKVTSIELDQTEQIFIDNGSGSFSPAKATIGYTVYPKNADNQKVIWTSTDPSVAIVNASGIVTPLKVGETTITAETEDGGFVDSVNVKVTLPYDLLEGIKTMADFVADTDRYNKIMALYDPNKIGINVPGQYVQSVKFLSTGSFTSGKITTDSAVTRVEVRVNDLQLSAPATSATEYLFNRAGLQYGDHIEVIAYNSAGDEVERISTSYSVDYTPPTSIPFGFYSIKSLISNPILFNQMLDQYSLEELRFVAR